MQNKFAIGAALAVAFALGATIVAYSSAQGDARTFSADQESEIREIVRQYIIENPEVMLESLNAHMARERTLAQAQSKDAARNNLAALTDPAHGYVTGKNPGGANVAVIELFDYHCGFCKKATGFVQDLTKSDADVKVVFREFPILRQESDEAAEFALAAKAQGKYQELHFALMNSSGLLTKDRIEDIAGSLGVDFSALEKAAGGQDIDAAIEETHRIADEMGVSGTPTFIIASLNGEFVEVIEGFNEPVIKQAIADAKKAAKR